MPRVGLSIIVIFIASQTPVFSAECFYPEDVIIPDGEQSTYEEMKASEAYVREYMAGMEEYLDCLDQETLEAEEQAAEPMSGTDPVSGTDPMSERTQQRNTAIDTMESVAAQFNEQVRAFKKANPR